MYNYPIDYDLFSTEEIIEIIAFLSLIEDINENRFCDKSLIKEKYFDYKKIINSKLIEKQIEKEFLNASGFSIYKTMKNIK